MTSPHRHSPLTSLAWSHHATTPRDAATATRLFSKALTDPSHPQPRVLNTDQARLYGSAMAGVKKAGLLRRRCRHRPVQYVNNIVGAGSSSEQTTRDGEAGLSCIPRGAANDPRLRGHAHDPEGAGEVGERFGWSATDSVHQQAVRGGCMRRRRLDPTHRSPASFWTLQHIQPKGSGRDASMVVTFIPQDCARNGFGARDPRRPSVFGLNEPLHLGGVAKTDVAESRFRPACSPTPAGRPPHHEPHSRDKHEHGHGLHIQQYPRDESRVSPPARTVAWTRSPAHRRAVFRPPPHPRSVAAS